MAKAKADKHSAHRIGRVSHPVHFPVVIAPAESEPDNDPDDQPAVPTAPAAPSGS